MCANIINFDSVDFSGRRPEEVISLFWRSVYIQSDKNYNYNVMLYKHKMLTKFRREKWHKYKNRFNTRKIHEIKK